MNKNKIKIKVAISKENYDKLKSYDKEKLSAIVDEALIMYFNKDFCARELERNVILGIWLLDENYWEKMN